MADLDKAELIRRLLVELGLTATSLDTKPVPTVAEYMPRVLAAASDWQLKTYATHWRRAKTSFGERKIDEISASDVLALQRQGVRANILRANSRGGRHAGENAVRAMRTFFRLAVHDGALPHGWDPTSKVRLPRRLPPTRRALTTKEMAAINHVVATGGQDMALDSLLLRLHTETACRRSGALGLRVADLDAESCAIRLREKFGTERWQPISPTMVAALVAHARSRGAREPSDQLLRYASGTALSSRRYDLLWMRVRVQLPWAAKLGVSIHWMRHTTLTWVERHFGYAVARAYAGHTDTRAASTLTYIKGMPQEVARALSAYAGEPHPLADLGRL